MSTDSLPDTGWSTHPGTLGQIKLYAGNCKDPHAEMSDEAFQSHLPTCTGNLIPFKAETWYDINRLGQNIKDGKHSKHAQRFRFLERHVAIALLTNFVGRGVYGFEKIECKVDEAGVIWLRYHLETSHVPAQVVYCMPCKVNMKERGVRIREIHWSPLGDQIYVDGKSYHRSKLPRRERSPSLTPGADRAPLDRTDHGGLSHPQSGGPSHHGSLSPSSSRLRGLRNSASQAGQHLRNATGRLKERVFGKSDRLQH